MNLAPDLRRGGPRSAETTLSILVVDDEPALLTVLCSSLGKAGHDVVCASSGNKASRLLNRHRFDLLITDILMPDGDGVQLIEEFKRRQPAARILAISGGGNHLKGANCLTIASGFGAHAVLAKPFNRLQLFRGIEAALTSSLWVAKTSL